MPQDEARRQTMVAGDRVIAFGPFRLQPAQQLLSRAGEPVSIGSRALDILMTLIERAGELVTKEELFARVWPNTSVDETSLRAQVAALRKALGDWRRRRAAAGPVPPACSRGGSRNS